MRQWMRRRPDGDSGYSLMEVLVTTGIMSVVMASVLTATIQIYSGTKQIDQVSVARDQLDNSFRRLDRELRYATWVSPKPGAGTDGTRWYMEFTLPPRDKKEGETAEPPIRCRQLILDTTLNALRIVDWDVTDTAQGPATTLATDVFREGEVNPFTPLPPGGSPYATASPGTAGVGSQFSNTYAMVRLQFRVQSGTVNLPFDNVFTSQNINADNYGDKASDDDKQCSKGKRP